jgi:hypothetical protein
MITMTVVMFTDLADYEAADDLIFETYPFENLEYVLVTPDTLIGLIEDQYEQEQYTKLLGALRAIPEGVLVSIQG